MSPLPATAAAAAAAAKTSNDARAIIISYNRSRCSSRCSYAAKVVTENGTALSTSPLVRAGRGLLQVQGVG
jgi:hypothetical protein